MWQLLWGNELTKNVLGLHFSCDKKSLTLILCSSWSNRFFLCSMSLMHWFQWFWLDTKIVVRFLNIFVRVYFILVYERVHLWMKLLELFHVVCCHFMLFVVTFSQLNLIFTFSLSSSSTRLCFLWLCNYSTICFDIDLIQTNMLHI